MARLPLCVVIWYWLPLFKGRLGIEIVPKSDVEVIHSLGEGCVKKASKLSKCTCLARPNRKT